MATAARRGLVGLLGQGIVIQAILSAASLLVSVVLIRAAPAAEFGYYVLALSAILLLTALQNAFLQPPLVLRLAQADDAERRALVAGTVRLERTLVLALALAGGGVLAVAALGGLLAGGRVALVLAALAAAVAALHREFFRMLLMARHEPAVVLRLDLVYCALHLGGVFLAARSGAPATLALVAMAVAAGVAGLLLEGALGRRENLRGAEPRAGLLRTFAHAGGWSAAGSATHWAFSQGYNYMAAALLDVTAVAALAATRLTLTPINLLSSGIGPMMLPAASRWLNDHDERAVLRRLLAIAAGVAALAVAYLGVLWLGRDWLFAEVLARDYAQRDLLILAWVPVFLVMVFRDQILYLPGAAGRFRSMALVTLAGALMALAVMAVALRGLGPVGAPLGVLCGELVNLAGMGWLSWREIRDGRRNPAVAR